ncbi:MAG: glycosyltransferase family 4 protein [Methanothrix sp.]|nr:glycosyltransferase family 4 protein [Methanothrix sp.]
MDSILHIGSIAGVPQELSAAQRRLGQRSDVLSFEFYDFGYRTDFHYPIKLDYSSCSSIYFANPINLLRKMPLLLPIARDYDLLHFHYSSGLPFGLDFPLWRMLKKKVVMHHHGTDIRHKGEHWLYARFSQRIFVSTPDLLEWSRDAIWVPNALDIKMYPFVGVKSQPTNEKDSIKILHAPSRRRLKGTEHVLSAIKKLKNEGYNIELILVERTPHKEALEYYKRADIVVDQLLIGWYGMLAQECMALGKPVCVYLREDLQGYMPTQPMLNTSPDNLLKNLRTLIEDPHLREELGKLGRRYVQEVHSSDRIARKLMDLYP